MIPLLDESLNFINKYHENLDHEILNIRSKTFSIDVSFYTTLEIQCKKYKA